MRNEHKEAFEAVEKINEELYTKYSKKDPKNFNNDSLDKMPILEITFAGVYLLIDLSIPSSIFGEAVELPIYFSERDDRIYYEKSNKYESFYKYIKRKFNLIKEELYAVKI